MQSFVGFCNVSNSYPVTPRILWPQHTWSAGWWRRRSRVRWCGGGVLSRAWAGLAVSWECDRHVLIEIPTLPVPENQQYHCTFNRGYTIWSRPVPLFSRLRDTASRWGIWCHRGVRTRCPGHWECGESQPSGSDLLRMDTDQITRKYGKIWDEDNESFWGILFSELPEWYSFMGNHGDLMRISWAIDGYSVQHSPLLVSISAQGGMSRRALDFCTTLWPIGEQAVVTVVPNEAPNPTI